MPSSTLSAFFTALAIPLLAFLTICGGYLLQRSRRVKISHVSHLGISFLFLAGFYIAVILRELNVWVPFLVSSIIGQIGIIALCLFITDAFYHEKPWMRKLVLVNVAIFATITASIAYARDFIDLNLLSNETMRIMHTVFATLQLSIASALQAGGSLRDYRRHCHDAVDAYVLFRYLMYGIAGLVVMASAWLDLVGTVFSILGMAEYESTQIIQVSFIFVYSVLNMIVWVMPRWVKNLINKRFGSAALQDEGIQVTEDEVMKNITRASNPVEDGQM